MTMSIYNNPIINSLLTLDRSRRRQRNAVSYTKDSMIINVSSIRSKIILSGSHEHFIVIKVNIRISIVLPIDSKANIW